MGKPSSRKIERATWEEVAYRVLSADQHPDHDSIAEFRKRHLKVLSSLFLQVLRLCQKAGLVKLGHVADPKAQRNFTDPESRIMKDGASKGFEQAYNAQIAVDEESQVIVAVGVTQETNDKKQLVPMMKKVKENTKKLPEAVSADAGYFSETNVTARSLKAVDLYIPPDRQKHGEKQPTIRGRPPKKISIADRMRRKLRTKAGQEVYRFRKAIVEPVFGQIKEARGIRRFSLRGLIKVEAEWTLVCLTHNLLKLFRSGCMRQAA